MGVENVSQLNQAYNEERKRIQRSAKDYIQKIQNDHEKLNKLLESTKRKLELQMQEFVKREALNKKSSLELAALEQERADENILKLADEHKALELQVVVDTTLDRAIYRIKSRI